MVGSCNRVWALSSNTLISFLLACPSSVLCNEGIDECRSNATHIAWPNTEAGLSDPAFAAAAARSMAVTESPCYYQERQEAEKDALAYLQDNIMDFDVPFRETMGFSNGEPEPGDGLGNGLIGPTVALALDAKVKFPWADGFSREIYFEYVLNYASTNEARSNWRPLVTTAIEPILSSLPSNASVNDVVRALNKDMWKALSRDGNPIFFKAEQTPLVFDPMSILAFGYGSCTGLAILFVNALRAAGIPARMAGTPAWQGDRERGNHNWVEVFRDGKWDFMEPSAPGGDNPDDLDRDPCRRWFCNANAKYGTTLVYAARLDRKHLDTFYRLAWEWNNTNVPGEDRTQYYKDVCDCGNNEGEG